MKYWLGFSAFPGVGPLRFKLLLDYFGSAEKAWCASSQELMSVGLGENLVNHLGQFKKEFSPEKYLDEIRRKNIHIITKLDDDYPSRLLEIPDPPFLLYIRGDVSRKLDWERAVAIVGTRKVTTYGREVTQKIVSGLVNAGCLIVSGLAYGVDATAHWAAIKSGGKTVGILGCGVDIIHPVSNTDLYWEIVNGKGVMISEYPVGQYASKGLFPARNRIISGLSRGVVVTEGAEKSGSLITARLALEQGREVFAVPGPITSELSGGTFKLIREGATPVAEASDVLDALNLKCQSSNAETISQNLNPHLSEDEKKIMNILKNESLHMDDLVLKTDVSASRLGSLLTMMELKGFVRNLGRGMWGT